MSQKQFPVVYCYHKNKFSRYNKWPQNYYKIPINAKISILDRPSGYGKHVCVNESMNIRLDINAVYEYPGKIIDASGYPFDLPSLTMDTENRVFISEQNSHCLYDPMEWELMKISSNNFILPTRDDFSDIFGEQMTCPDWTRDIIHIRKEGA